MGAYENPQGYIDTQTGQHYRDLQNTIAGSVASIASSYKERQTKLQEKYDRDQKRIEQLALQVGEEESALYRELGSAKVKNPTVDFETLYRPLIKEYATLRTGILNGTTKDPSGDRAKADKIFSSVNTLKESLVNMSAEDFVSKWEKRGTAGGYAEWGNDSGIMNGMLVFTNKLPGTKVPKLDENYQITWDVYDDNNKLVTSLNSDKIQQAINGNGLLKIIPDAAATVNGVKAANPDIFELKDGVPTGKIKDGYFIKGSEFEKDIPGKSTTIINGKKYDSVEYIPSIKVDKQAIAGDPNFEAMVKAKADVLLNGPGSDAAVFNNTYFKKKEGFTKLDPNEPLSDKDKAQFLIDYKQYILDGIPEDQPQPGAQKGVRTEKAGKTGTTGGDSNKKAQENAKKLADAKTLVYSITPGSGPQKIEANGRTVNWNKETGYTAPGVDMPFEDKAEVIAYLEGKATKSAEKKSNKSPLTVNNPNKKNN